MILNYTEACEQVQRLLKEYPNLNVIESTPKQIRISGVIEVYRSACGYTLQKDYSIEVIFPLNNEEFPTIRETNNQIASDYPHRYEDGILCLETNTAFRMRFIEGFDFVAWMSEYVEPYFFSYEFYTRFGSLPFGERPHGLNGIIHTYQELFHTDDFVKACSLIRYVAEEVYRGHAPCPCGSEIRLRKCHGQYLQPIMMDQRKKNIVISDLQYLRNELNAYEQSKRDNTKAKR